MKIISDNKKGMHGYKVIDSFECGLVLEGWEVKSARANTVTLSNAYCFFRKYELFLCNATFKKYMLLKVDETKDRKLLMHKNELLRLKTKLDKLPSATLIPSKIYFNNKSKIKVEVCLVQGMNKADKREQLKERDSKIYMEKSLLKY